MATWTMATIDASYPNVLSMAQNRSTGQYKLAIVTATAQGTAGAVCRAFKSSNYGATWDLLENLFTTSYADGRDLNYTTLQSLNRSTLYGCAISDDGKYQVVTQATYGDPKFMWYSTDYGVMTPKNDGADDGETTNKNPNAGWKWTTSNNIWPYDAGYLVKYTPGLYPVLIGSNGTSIWMDQRFTRPPGTAGIVTGRIITTRDVANSQGNEFTFDVPDVFPNGYGSTPVYCVFFITSGNLVRKNTGAVLENGANVTATIINPSGWPVSATEGGGVAVLSNSTTVYAARFVSGTGGGIWKSVDSGANWTQLQSGINVNAIGVSSNEQYIIAGPRTPTTGSGTFYISRDSGATWTTQVVSFSGYINYLYITNDGKHAIGGANRTEASSWAQYSSVGYFRYVGPLTAAEQRAAGKTVAELFALSFSQSEIISAGYSASELLAGGIVPGWNIDTTANRLKKSYVNDFIDLSGSLVLRNNANLYVHGNTTVNGKLLMNDTIMQSDLSFNKRIFVGGDTSMNGNVTIANDVSLNGSVLGCTFNSNSIPTSAFVSAVTASSPDYTKATVIYPKFQANADVSMNGSTVQATNVTVNGNIVFNDGTKMNTYDDNKSVNFGTPFSIKNTYNITGTNTSVSLPFLRNSADGKYVAVNYGGGTNNATGNTAAETGIDLSQDYGMTFNRIYLTKPVTGTPIYRPYSLIVMSESGRYIVATTYGDYIASEPHKTNTNVIGFSSDGGTTWTTAFINTILNLGTTVAYVNELMIDETTNKIAISVFVGSTSLFTYANNSMSLSGFAVIPTAVPSGVYSQFPGFTRLIGNRYVGINDAASDIVVKDLSGTTIAVSGRNPNGYATYTVHMSLSTSTIYMSGVIKNVGTVEYYRLDNLQTTPTLTLFTPLPIVPSGNRVNFCLSYSGKYVLCSAGGSNIIQNPILGARYNITFTSASDNRLYYSSDYGATFTSIPPVYTVTDHSSVAITDNGRAYILNTNTKTIGITVATASLFKASTFTGLTIKNTLTAGSYVVSSDYRIKTNVAKLDKTFTVNNLRPVKYLQTLINKKQYGLIAHELQQYYPDLVFGEKDGQDLQRVNYTGLIAILINEIIQLKQEFRELEKKRKVAI